MITTLTVDQSPVFRSIYCPHTLGQCPLHRWQMNCLACDRYSRTRRRTIGESYDTMPKTNRRNPFYETLSSYKDPTVIDQKEPAL